MDISSLRSQTPGTAQVIHFNNAGASLMPSVVSETVIGYIQQESNFGGYETADKFQQKVKGTYDTISSFINAKPNEIALVENATTAWNMGFCSIDFKANEKILTSAHEYASNYINYLKLQESTGISIEVIPNDSSGKTSVKALKNMMDDRVKLISITHMPTNSGVINPVEKIGQIANQHDCFYLVDACQSVGHYPVDVAAIGCDLLSATGRKYLRGPRGTGFLYVNENILDELRPPFLDLHAAEWVNKNNFVVRQDARKFENWESNYAGILGLKEAISYASDLGIHNIWPRVKKLSRHLRSQISSIPHYSVHDMGDEKSGIIAFTSDKMTADSIKRKLSDRNINVSTSSKRSTLIDMQQRNLEKVVRASVHYYNNKQDIKKLVTGLTQIL